jgi:hypothetical protein
MSRRCTQGEQLGVAREEVRVPRHKRAARRGRQDPWNTLDDGGLRATGACKHAGGGGGIGADEDLEPVALLAGGTTKLFCERASHARAAAANAEPPAKAWRTIALEYRGRMVHR